jgi:subtilisin family serine protease
VDPATWELLRAEAGTDGDRVLEAIIRLARPGIEIPDVRIVSRFGTIATCRIRARDVIAVRARPDVCSFKAARGLSPDIEPGFGPLDAASPALPAIRPTDIRRDPALTLTGAGVAVAVVGWGADVDSAALRWPDDPAAAGQHRPGGSRFLSFWDQRDQAVGPPPDPYGYGTVHDREEIDRALQDPRPYERLGYHPGIADPQGTGSHDTRTLSIAAGNGRDGGPEGIAPEADLIFVHLADRNTGGLAPPFGDSVRALEAVDYISRTAGSQPCSINISAGRICGPHTGTALVEMAFDELLASKPGLMISQSGGNYARRRAHSCGTIAPGEARSLTVVVDPADITLNEVEIWYDGADEFTVRIDPPGYTAGRPVCLGERSDLLIEGRVIGRVYHRKHDPNNGDNHIVAYLDPVGRAGNWRITLEARKVCSGRFHAWIERDDSCPGCQARFTPNDSNTVTTVGSITTSHLPLIVGAYNAHDPARPAAPFSSHGPSRDGRLKPDLVAPGVDVLATRSAPIGASRNPGLLVYGSGTSFAAPHVAGAVALCFEAAGNRLSAHAIRSLVLGSCDPVTDSDPNRLGCGYLNVPRLVADVQRALAPQATPPSAKEPTMDTEDAIVLLAAVPATAYREYLYRPHGQLARWIGDRFDVVARPGQRISQPLRKGDVLLEVTLGHTGPGRCVALTAGGLPLAASPPRLAPGQLVLRPRKRLGMSAPLTVEPAVDTQGTDLDRLVFQGPEDQLTEALLASFPNVGLAASGSSPDKTAEISVVDEEGDSKVAEDATDSGGPTPDTPGEAVSQEADRTSATEAAVETTAWLPWTELILHRVPAPIVADLARRRISIPDIKDAYGDINLDYYPIRISRMPSLYGRQLAPEELLSHIRHNFDAFVDTNNASFPPLDNSVDKPRWQSDNPLGAVINIQIHALGFIDQGLVVCSAAESRLWIFTTAHGGPAGYHPVTGNRMWGIRSDGNEWVLFTRGADRATQLVDYVGNVAGSIWSGADVLWRSFQTKVKDFICVNHGLAVVIDPVSKRWAWKSVQSSLSPVPGKEASSHEEEQRDGQSAEESLPHDRYGGYTLQRGDLDDASRYGGTVRTARGGDNPPSHGITPYITQLRRDLRELGFRMAGPDSGSFDRSLEWAVREFQIYSKMPNVAREAATGSGIARYVDRLAQVVNTRRYRGPVSGTVNPDTRATITHWLDNRWRCPVVVEAWNMAGRDRASLHEENIWLHDDVPSPQPRMFVRDFSGYYTLPHGRNPADLVVLGDHVSYMRWDGPRSIPPQHTWAEAELLPENLVGPRLTALSAAQRSTFKVVRASSEVECIGFFDSLNAYDNAFVSLGPCHWTLGIVNGTTQEGELCGYLSYLRNADPAAFAQAIEFFGVQNDKAWDAAGAANGRALFDKGSRKYTGWVALQQEDGSFVRMPLTEEDGNYFKTWHWFYRLVMAGRTVEGFRHRMWHMARVRIRDIRETPWGPGVELVPDGHGGTRAPTIGDIYTSERALGMLLRWHIRFPAHIVRDGRAGNQLRHAYSRAAIPSTAGNPSAWTDAHEIQLVQGLRDEVAAGHNAEFINTINYVDHWPQWAGGVNPRGYVLDPNVGSLATARSSFKFDDGELPPAPY